MPRDAAVLARSSVRGALPLLHADAPLPLRAVPRMVYASPDSSRRLDRAFDEVVRGPRPRELDLDANPRVLLGELVHNPAKSILVLTAQHLPDLRGAPVDSAQPHRNHRHPRESLVENSLVSARLVLEPIDVV